MLMNDMKKICSLFWLLAFSCALSVGASGEPVNRWTMLPDGSIVWKVAKDDAHADHVEMSGRRLSVVLRYGINKEGAFTLNKSLVFPMLRIKPNNTFSNLQRRYNWNALNFITVNGYSLLDEKVDSVVMKGLLRIESNFQGGHRPIHVSRIYFPSPDKPVFIELITLTNRSKETLTFEVPDLNVVTHTEADKGIYGAYSIIQKLDKPGVYYLKPGDSLELMATISAYKEGEKHDSIDGKSELAARESLVSQWMNKLVLESPDSVINRMFAFSKIRACESIYATKGGPMHGPGGEAYYAAIWANDQAEYISPYFPFTGYEYGCQSALNAYMHFARFMNKEWNPIPSSIISEGVDIWQGAGDRGDAAMIAYGAGRYALARASKEEAQRLWPLIRWCLEYCHRKLNAEGVVSSKSDELEGRFPSGTANLNTSSLYYDALLSAAYLNAQLGGDKSVAESYRSEAKTLRKNIESYFGNKVDGFDTYSYYKGNDKLRAWICTPLVMGIEDRAKGTIEALLSPQLWTENGLLSQEGSNTFWDRSTLYALRGIFIAGETEKAVDYLHFYSNRRLLGEHVPYAIEAWPEGSQRHLSAESGLYGRVITEGMFGIRPTGFSSFTCSPRLPKDWDKMALRHIEAFNADFDIEVTRVNGHSLKVLIKRGDRGVITKVIREGDTFNVHLHL
jgi:hypothetical protein